ncbi:hypothetical protein MHP7448_0696 [Mesomycoplasma hyopneumoniae 7448]|uniref:Uncharacterized protein n=1 Tax=Mesomycoplasma hyopneumoniae (strain 7448) TaxID=262722 RepID=A4Q7W3_MESH7|nr:hypothetical protein MHP7448_0696 [Mesomycoplasma hyopneumoniae 7448]
MSKSNPFVLSCVFANSSKSTLGFFSILSRKELKSFSNFVKSTIFVGLFSSELVLKFLASNFLIWSNVFFASSRNKETFTLSFLWFILAYEL